MKPKIGIIGCGYWGKHLVRNFHQLGALNAICDVNPACLQEHLLRYEGIQGFDDPQKMLSDSEISAVVIASPAETHYRLAKKALLAGKDVFVEKPLALKAREGEDLVALAEWSKRILMVGHLLEYHFGILKLKEWVKSGQLGQIHYIYSNRLNLGKVRREENILWSFAPHDISILLTLTGEMPIEVNASGGNYLQAGIADVTVTTMLFPGGTRAHIFVSWLHPFKEHKLVVIGSRKMAVFNDAVSEGKLRIYDKGIEWVNGDPLPRETSETILYYPEGEPLRNECLHFLEAVEKRSRPRTDGYSGLRVLHILEACQDSMENAGVTVKLGYSDKEVAVGS